MRPLPVLLLGAVAVGVAACGDDTATTSSPNQERRAAAAPHKTKWLELSSDITPAQWLVSRKEDKPRPIDDAETRRIAALLSKANDLYRESERMIANRSAQLSDMLASIGIDESAPLVLEDLTSIAGEVGQTEGFGAVSQHYFNLRAAHVGRGEALATLKSRYGRRQAKTGP